MRFPDIIQDPPATPEGIARALAPRRGGQDGPRVVIVIGPPAAPPPEIRLETRQERRAAMSPRKGPSEYRGRHDRYGKPR